MDNSKKIKKNKKKLNERGRKRPNAKLECYLARPHALLHEVSAFIYIYIYILMGAMLKVEGDMFAITFEEPSDPFTFIMPTDRLLSIWTWRFF